MRGLPATIANCGPWPEVGTTAQYMNLITAASDEVARAHELWVRYARRYDLLDFTIDSGPPRLAARFRAAQDILHWRRERLTLLLFGGMVGGR